MARFIIFIGTALAFSVVGIMIYWAWSRINISIKRRESVFEIEKEAHKRAKKKIKEEKEQ